MPSGALPTSSYDFLRMIEEVGTVGCWAWDFAGNTHVWSPGLFGILGIPAGLVRADYHLLFRLIHPDDCPQAMDPRFLRQAEAVAPHTFRILRPDTQMRTVTSRIEIVTSPQGRPVGARGILVDVSDRAELERVAATRRRSRRGLFESLRAFTSTTAVYPYTKFSDEWLDLVGMPENELLDEPTLPVLKDERRHWRDHGRELYLSKRIVHTMPNLRLANGETATYRMVMVPLLNEAREVESWTNLVSPIQLNLKPSGSLLRGLEQQVGAPHIRASRALLDWSMTELSQAAGVSLSTVRRLEGGGESVSDSNRDQIVAALRRAGIVFTLTEDADIAVGKGTRRIEPEGEEDAPPLKAAPSR